MYAQESGMPFALYAYASSVLWRARRGRGMTRDEAAQMVEALVAAHGARGGGDDVRPFEDGDAFGVMLGASEVFFEYAEATGELWCRALVYRFRGEPRPGVLEGFFSEEREGTTDAGGGAVEYLRGPRALFLSRSYDESLPADEFAGEIERLAGASLVWGREVLERVAAGAARRGR